MRTSSIRKPLFLAPCCALGLGSAGALAQPAAPPGAAPPPLQTAPLQSAPPAVSTAPPPGGVLPPQGAELPPPGAALPPQGGNPPQGNLSGPPPGQPYSLPPIDPAWSWRPGDRVPSGYRIRYSYNTKMIIGGASVIALSVTATTLIASSISFATFPIGAFVLPVSAIPVVGPFPYAAFAAGLDAGTGTVATLIALGATQLVGFGVMMGGLVGRKKSGIVPDCREADLAILPFASPGAGGITLRGTL